MYHVMLCDHVMLLYSLDLLESLVHYEVLRHDTLECKVSNIKCFTLDDVIMCLLSHRQDENWTPLSSPY